MREKKIIINSSSSIFTVVEYYLHVYMYAYNDDIFIRFRATILLIESPYSNTSVACWQA